VSVDLPDVKGRQAIFNVHLKPLKLADELVGTIGDKLAVLTPVRHCLLALEGFVAVVLHSSRAVHH